MPESFASDIVQRIDAQVATGQFASHDEVIRAALSALEQQQEDWEAIELGITDMEAGRYRPFSQVDAELRSKHNIPRDK